MKNLSNKDMFILRFLVAAISVSSLVIWWVYFNEARKEVYYLCGNFSKGNSYSSVIRQLNTINLSEYKLENTAQGKRATHSSKFNFHLFTCTIEFNAQEKVVSVSYG